MSRMGRRVGIMQTRLQNYLTGFSTFWSDKLCRCRNVMGRCRSQTEMSLSRQRRFHTLFGKWLIYPFVQKFFSQWRLPTGSWSHFSPNSPWGHIWPRILCVRWLPMETSQAKPGNYTFIQKLFSQRRLAEPNPETSSYYDSLWKRGSCNKFYPHLF